MAKEPGGSGQGRVSLGAGWYHEAAVLSRLARQQKELVAQVLTRAAQSERVSAENRRLAHDLEGSLDRLQEVHHRVRNHLQLVTGLLSAQGVTEESPTARQALQQTVARLTSVAAIHDLLSRDARSGELRLGELAERLSAHLLAQAGAEGRLGVETDVAPLRLEPREATAFVLILTELLTNAIRHGFPADEAGRIKVRAAHERGEGVLEVRDTGRGLPSGFDLAETRSLGLRLVTRLAERDLNGRAEAWNSGGACFRVAFPLPGPGVGGER